MLIIFLRVLPREGARASFTPGEKKGGRRQRAAAARLSSLYIHLTSSKGNWRWKNIRQMFRISLPPKSLDCFYSAGRNNIGGKERATKHGIVIQGCIKTTVSVSRPALSGLSVTILLKKIEHERRIVDETHGSFDDYSSPSGSPETLRA